MIEFILPFAMNPMVMVCRWGVMIFLADNAELGSWDDGFGNVELLGFEGKVELGSLDDDIINCLGNVALGCCEVFGNVELSG